jgi:Terminase large subunit, T4likevirus-type, N-terminal
MRTAALEHRLPGIRRQVARLRAAPVGELPDTPVDLALAGGIEPDEWQRGFLLSHGGPALLLTSRQVGKTTAASILALHTALTKPGSLVLSVAPALRQSSELMLSMLGFYRDLGRPVPATAEGRLHLELANGSRIVGLPGSERTIRGFGGVDLLILDEAARIDDELYYALRPMLAVSGGRMVMLSTPYGKRGVFYEQWTGGEHWERYEITPDMCPRLTPEYLEAERRSIPGPIYAQEYQCEFIDLEWQLFPSSIIDKAIDDTIQPISIGRRAS